MSRRSLTLIIFTICAVLIGVGTTLAYIVASTREVKNTFTVGDINITLTETTGDTYGILPGATLKKDPVITVKGGSEACWLFVELSHTADIKNYIVYELADGWTALEGKPDIYYRNVGKTDSDIWFSVLKNNSVTVSDTITEEDMSFIHTDPTLTVRGYAVQRDNITTPAAAWDAVISEKGE